MPCTLFFDWCEDDSGKERLKNLSFFLNFVYLFDYLLIRVIFNLCNIERIGYMKNYLQKALALLFSFTLILGNLNLSVYANTESPEVSEPSEEEILNDNNDNSELETEILAGESSWIQYLAVTEPYLITPNTETFVLSFQSGMEEITLVYTNEAGDEQSISGLEQESGKYIFNKDFSDSDSGIYKVSKIQYKFDQKLYEIVLSDLDMDVTFGINQKYEGYDGLGAYALDENGKEINIDMSDVASSIVRLDDSNESYVADEINSVLSLNGISTYADEITEENPLIIALDPGHGGPDSGAIAVNGQCEKEFTLKIAKYVKEELDKYENLEVILLRDSDTSVSGSSDLKEELMARCQKAKDAGASVLISLHLNASEGHNSNGVEVYYPNGNYNQAVSDDGKVLAQSILDELKELGIADRGIKVRTIDEDDPEYNYPDGSHGDYYAIIRNSKKLGLTGIIVEHCFLDNASDFDKYLSSEEKIKQLAIADANGIAKAFDLVEKDRMTELDELAFQNKDVLKDGLYSIHSSINSNYVLDVQKAGLTDRTNVQLYTANGTGAQTWKVSHDEKGYVTFTNVNSSKVLDVNKAIAKSGNNVQQYTSNNTYAQKWIVKEDGTIVSALDIHYVLDLQKANVKNGSNIQLYKSNGTNAQKWKFKRILSQSDIDEIALENKDVLEDGVYTIHSSMNTNYVLDVAKAGLTDRTNVQLYTANGTGAQTWRVSHDKKGYVTFLNTYTGKALDVNKAIAKSGSNIQQYTSNNTYAQKWIVKEDGTIVSALDIHYVLDLQKANVKNGSNIQLYKSNGTNAQKWMFKEAFDRGSLDRLARENKNVLHNSEYIIHSSLDSNYVVDVQNGSKDSGANVQLSESKKTDAQVWKVVHDSIGYVSFINKHSNKALDLAKACVESGSNIQQYTSNNTYAQKWIVKKDGTIVSALDSNYVIELENGDVQDSSNIQLSQSNGTEAQKWNLEELKKGFYSQDGSVYFYNNEGKLMTGNFTYKNVKYCADNNGKIYRTDVQNVKYLCQKDSRWANKVYGGYYFGGTGCVPTVMTMMMNRIYNENKIPTDYGDLLYWAGHFNGKKGLGSDAESWKYIAERNKLPLKTSLDLNELKTELLKGHMVTMAVNPGKFCPAGYTH